MMNWKGNTGRMLVSISHYMGQIFQAPSWSPLLKNGTLIASIQYWMQLWTVGLVFLELTQPIFILVCGKHHLLGIQRTWTYTPLTIITLELQSHGTHATNYVCGNYIYLCRYAIPPEHGQRLERMARGRL